MPICLLVTDHFENLFHFEMYIYEVISTFARWGSCIKMYNIIPLKFFSAHGTFPHCVSIEQKHKIINTLG